MKTTITILLFFMLASFCVHSQTSIAGGAVSGTWTKANSPYMVGAAIMVANGSSLSIEAGVRVEFQGSFKFLNLGKITAVGNAQDSIVFTATNHSTGWRGIRFDQTDAANDSSRFVYCRFEYGNTLALSSLDGYGGAIGIANFSKILISNSLFSHCQSFAGGAIRCGGSGARISNNTFSNNSATESGAIECSSFNYHTIISNNLFLNNTSTSEYGGAIGTWDDAQIYNNVFIGNTSMATDYCGGAIYCGSSSFPIIRDNYFRNNSSPHGGGGALYCYESRPVIYNNVITNNSALTGGGIQMEGTNMNMYNNTIANNSATKGGAIYFKEGSTDTIRNTIMWGNTATTGNEIFLENDYCDPNFFYCDLEGGKDAIGMNSNIFYLGTYTNNIDANPMFVSPVTGSIALPAISWYLLPASPCINAGDPSGSYPGTDIASWPRITNGRIDMGAYEYALANGIPQNNVNDTFKMYPNPSPGKLTVLTSAAGLTSFDVFDSKGMILFSAKAAQNFPTELNLEGLPDGIYFIRSGSLPVQKIILQK